MAITSMEEETIIFAMSTEGITATGMGMRDVDTDRMATGREDMIKALQASL